MRRVRLAVVGTGYVGLVAGAGFADFGNHVACVDVDEKKIERLNRGEIPIYEPGLDHLIAKNRDAGRISFSTNVAEAMRGAELVFVAVGTPPAADGSADLSAVFAVGETFAEALDDFKVIATKSTVPVGTADRLRAHITERTDKPFAVASNPEFLKEGDAINDFMKPDRVVVGADDSRARELLRNLYSPFVRTRDRIQTMDPRSAELTKYAANAMLATRISFMNDLAVLAEKVGADIEAVRKGVGSDPRIGPKFLFPGPGFGGSCFPKDLSALEVVAEKAGHELRIVTAAQAVNADQKHVLGSKVKAHFGDRIRGATIAVWGLAFKPETDDIRESPALVLLDDLLQAGAKVRAFDPQAMDNVRALVGDRLPTEGLELCASPYEAAEGADALVLVTEWHEFRAPDFRQLAQSMREKNLFDGRNVWLPQQVVDLGFSHWGIGRQPRTP